MKEPKKFLERLLEFAKTNKKNLTDKIIKKFTNEVFNDDNFNESKASLSGDATEGFYHFCNSIYQFKMVYDQTAPIRNRLKV